MEETKDKINANPINAIIPLKFSAGRSTHFVLIPWKLKLTILNPSTNRVTKYSAIAEDTHRNTPKVTRFNGSNKMFITGFASSDVNVSAPPAINKVNKPCSNSSPPAI